MRTRRSAAPVHALLLVVLTAACADAPSAPARAPLAPQTAHAAKSAAPPPAGYVDVNGETFAQVQAMPGGWMEGFNIYSSDQTTWVTPPKFWLPADASAISLVSYSFSGTAQLPNSLPGWAIVKHTRDRQFWYAGEPMTAWHDGATCNAPPATHTVTSYDEYPFLCRNHMMTATNASGYGVTYLTPDRLVDFSSGDAVVRFDVATLRSSARDWIDLWITPYDDNLVVPLDDSLPDAQGLPASGLHIRMAAERNRSRFEATLIISHRGHPQPVETMDGYETAFAARGLAPSATRRDTFELRLSDGRLQFGMPRYDLWWLDTKVPPGQMNKLSRAVVQIGHHSFQPTADGAADTWHWDNIGMAPATKFTIINADRRYVDQSTMTAATFTRPAPAAANLRFAGYGSNFEVSFDGGPWRDAARQDEQRNVPGRFHSYWTPVPRGTTRVAFRADNDPADRASPTAIWMARDITVWSLNP